MRKTIAKFLVFLMLLSNAAWAVDASASAFFGHSVEQTQLANNTSDSLQDQNPSEQQNLEHNDHCCHGVAHLIGMTSTKLTHIEASRDVGRLQNTTTLISYNHLPPTPPPTY